MKRHEETQTGPDLSVVYDVLRASGGRLEPLNGVHGGGNFFSGGEAASLREAAAVLEEAYHSSGGSRALFEARVRERLGVVNGERKMVAALALVCALAGPALGATPGNSDGGEDILIGTVYIPSVTGVTLSGGTAPEHMGVYNGGSASGTTINSGGSQWVYSGGTAVDTTVSNGGRQYVNSNGIAANTDVSSGGTLTISDGGSLIYDIMIHDGGLIEPSAPGDSTALDEATLTLEADAVNMTVDNNFTGEGNIIKTGSGTVTLSGSNTLTGGTLVEGGTLSGPIGSGPLTVSGGATYDAGLGFVGSASVASLSGGGTVIADPLTVPAAATFPGP
jgi:autotransporter passenger strand-loop-strand repeat protein/autotransporter-associated beta strand protein